MSMAKYIRNSTMQDVNEVANSMREADKREVKSMTGSSPFEALLRGYENSNPCLTLVGDGGELVGMCGVAPTEEQGVGAIWMLGTNHLTKYAAPFIRHSREAIDTLMVNYQLVFNLVDARNTLHVKWLRWAGFTFLKKHDECGVDKIPAYEFIRLKYV